MKKIILSLMILFAAISASAQVYVGGSLAWTHDDNANVGADINQFKLAPEVGYNLNDDWAVAVELAYTHGKTSSAKSNAFSIAPYARYTFFEKNIVRLFLDGGVGFSTYKVKGTDSDNGFEIGIKPGIAVSLTPKLSLRARYGFLGYRDKYAGAGAGRGSISGLDFNPNSLSLGIKYEF